MIVSSKIIHTQVFRNLFAKFQHRLDSLQVKQAFAYELPHDLPNELRLWILKIRKYWGKSKTNKQTNLVSSFPSKNTYLAQAVKNSVKIDIKVISSCPISLNVFTFPNIFCRRLQISFYFKTLRLLNIFQFRQSILPSLLIIHSFKF